MKVLKYALIFLAGAGTGFVGSTIHYHIKAQKLQKKFDREFAEMDEYYKEQCANCGVSAEPEEEEEKEEEAEAERVSKPEKRQGSFATDYTKCYGDDPAESEHPVEDERIPTRPKLPPKLIKHEDYGKDGYSTRVLYYYTADDALIPEESTYEDIIDTDEVKDMIGNALDKYGFRESDQRGIYVRNFDRKCDYKIIKEFGSLSEDYGG